MHWDCRETVPEQVIDKERANFCDYFRLDISASGERTEERDRKQRARSAFDDLFH